jgi:hypothetical protein
VESSRCHGPAPAHQKYPRAQAAQFHVHSSFMSLTLLAYFSESERDPFLHALHLPRGGVRRRAVAGGGRVGRREEFQFIGYFALKSWWSIFTMDRFGFSTVRQFVFTPFFYRFFLSPLVRMVEILVGTQYKCKYSYTCE